jgi:hypothetical protein
MGFEGELLHGVIYAYQLIKKLNNKRLHSKELGFHTVV